MAKGIKIQGTRVQKIQQQFIVKIVLVVLLVVMAVGFVLANRHLLTQNKKMMRYIANQEVFRQAQKSLEESENRFANATIPITSGTDVETLKNEKVNQLLNVISMNQLTVESYRSEIEKKDGFVIFKIDITLTGDFVQVLRFFSLLRGEAPFAYVTQYNIQLHMEKFVRMGLMLEIVGLEQ